MCDCAAGQGDSAPPSTWRSGGSAARHGDQRDYTERRTRVHPARRSGMPGEVLLALAFVHHQPFHTPLFFDSCLAGAPCACTVDRQCYLRHLRGRERWHVRPWLDLSILFDSEPGRLCGDTPAWLGSLAARLLSAARQYGGSAARRAAQNGTASHTTCGATRCGSGTMASHGVSGGTAASQQCAEARRAYFSSAARRRATSVRSG